MKALKNLREIVSIDTLLKQLELKKQELGNTLKLPPHVGMPTNYQTTVDNQLAQTIRDSDFDKYNTIKVENGL